MYCGHGIVSEDYWVQGYASIVVVSFILPLFYFVTGQITRFASQRRSTSISPNVPYIIHAFLEIVMAGKHLDGWGKKTVM